MMFILDTLEPVNDSGRVPEVDGRFHSQCADDVVKDALADDPHFGFSWVDQSAGQRILEIILDIRNRVES